MKKYSDKNTVQSSFAPSNLEQGGQQRNMLAGTQGALGLNQSLQGFFGDVGNIANTFGEQNAEIQGQEEAQKNTEAWLKHIQKRDELQKLLEQSQKGDLIKSNVPADMFPNKGPVTIGQPKPEGIVGDGAYGDGVIEGEDGDTLDPTKPAPSVDFGDVEPVDNEAQLNNALEVIKEDKNAQYTKSIDTRVIQKELAEQEAFISNYVEATRRNPTINIKEFTRQREQAKLFKDHLSMKYESMTHDAYENFRDDPEGFKKITQNFTQKLVEGLPDNMVGSAMLGFKHVNEEYSRKINDNFEVKQKEELLTNTNMNLEETINTGSKMAYNGADWGMYANRISSNLTTLFNNDLISGPEYSRRLGKITKEFESQSIMGNFDRVIDLEGKYDAEKMKQGYAELARFDNPLQKKEGESLQEYELRTKNFTQTEVDVIKSDMRRKLSAKETSYNKGVKLQATQYNRISKDIYKNMWKGITPKNLDELKLFAGKNNDLENFNQSLIAMNEIQKLNTMTIDEQNNYIQSFDEDKLKGLSESEIKIAGVVETNYKENLSLAEKDPIALMIKQGKTQSLIGKDPKTMMSILQDRAQKQDSMQVDYNNQGIISDAEANELSYTLNNVQAGQEFQTISNISQSVGPKLSKELFNKMYKKNANGMVYTAGIMNPGNISTIQKISNGFAIMKDPGFKWDTDRKKDLNDVMTTDFVQATQSIPGAANGIREAVTARYVMGDVTPQEAFNEVTNGLDSYNGQFIMPYSKGKSANGVYDDVTNILRNGVPQMNEPFIGSKTFEEEFRADAYQLVNAGTNKYYFKIKDTGVWAVDKQNKPLVFTFGIKE